MQLTISIIVMGQQPLILPCLESIEAQTKTEHEICLVNNIASPALINTITSRFPQVKIIHNTRRLSFAANHNQVMRRSNGQFVLLLNDDTVILDRAIDRMIDFLNSQPGQIGIAGCTNLNGQGNLRLSCHPFLTAKGVIWRHAKLGRWFPGRVHDHYLSQAKGAEPFSVDWVQGSCMAIHKDVIAKIGYLDEDFFLFGEEVDYCYRAKQAGFSVYHIPQAQIIHYESASTSRFIPMKIRGSYLSTLYFFAKHQFNRDLKLIRPWFIVELFAKSILRAAGALINRPADARVRLQVYLDLIRICATYKGQPALEFAGQE